MLDAAARARLDGLALAVRGGMGERRGERRFPGRPDTSGIEVEGHAPYAPGDDLRHLDWNVLGRLDQLVVRRFTTEREVCCDVLLDASASMGVPAADDKLGTARALAAALALVALGANDGVRLVALTPDGPMPLTPTLRQRGSLPRFTAALLGVRSAGAVPLGAALEAHARRERRPGAALVVSDCMEASEDIERGVVALRSRGWAVVLLRVIGAGERDPTRALGDGMLRDVETGATHPVALTPATLARYDDLLAAHTGRLAELAARSGTVFASMEAPGDAIDFVTGELARRGVVRRR